MMSFAARRRGSRKQADTEWSVIAEATYNFIEGLVADH